MTYSPRILLTGAGGQVGTELCLSLRKRYPKAVVMATDIKPLQGPIAENGPVEELDVLDSGDVARIIAEFEPDHVYHLAAMLSATSEQKPQLGWRLNMESLLTFLDLAAQGKFQRLFWPSSIGAFGPQTPKVQTPQNTVMDPTTVYGISKLAGERWCRWYHHKHGVDVRSLRYPGLISYHTQPGGGTTDYAVDIFIEALRKRYYQCFLRPDTTLPMMYIDDAIRATIELMEADPASIGVRSSYNVAGISFSPRELAQAIEKRVTGFAIEYVPDYRQQIAESWPQSIDDRDARNDWGWQPAYDMEALVDTMLEGLAVKL
jgi:nucleoside-diphosphate-sugar epimerase